MIRLPGAALFLVLFGALLRRACPTIFHDDSPETVIACLTLGVTHPPGDAPLALLGRLWLLLPLGAPALRLNLLAAASFAGAAALLWRAVARRAAPAAAGLTGVAVALLVLTNPEVAHQAAVAKGASYGVTLLLLTAGATFAWRGHWIAVGLIAGLLTAHHWMTAAAYGAIAAVAIAAARAGRPSARGLATHACCAVIGASVMLALPIRAAARPGYDAGGVTTAGRLAVHVFRSGFAAEETRRPLADRLAQAGPVAASVARQAGPAGIFAAAAAVAVLLRAGALPLAPLGVALLGPPLLAGAYLALPPDRRPLYDTFLLPTWWLLVALVAGWIKTARSPRRIAASLALAAAAQIAFQAGPVADRIPARATWAHDFARAQLAPLPRAAVVLAASDLDTFPLWHAGIAEGIRPDVTVVCWTLLRHRWYREQAGRMLGLPGLGDAPDRAAAAALICWTTRRPVFTVPVPLDGVPSGRAVPVGLLIHPGAGPARRAALRGWSARGFHEAARRARDWRAGLATGYTAETLHRLMQAGATGRL